MNKFYSILKLGLFYWVVLAVVGHVILSAPKEFLQYFNLESDVINGLLRALIGGITITCDVLILCHFGKKIYNFFSKMIGQHAARKKAIKQLMQLSNEEKILLYMAIKINMPTVFAPIDNPVAQTLVSRGMLGINIAVADPLRFPFRIPTSLWGLLILKREVLFSEQDKLSDERLQEAIRDIIHLT
ncbi:MAG: super-infection exclusion protein B [Candidatus Omnitrophota bacterium]|nr:super-infection exclusion protein B [Candidatus Omnitrophota bacterium]